MKASKIVRAFYNDDDVLLSAVKTIKDNHYHIEEVYTPFPVHGLDKALGLEPTRIAIASFLFDLFTIISFSLFSKYAIPCVCVTSF